MSGPRQLKLRQPLFQHLLASIQYILSPGFMVWAERLFKFLLSRVIERAAAVMVPAVFFAQRMKYVDRRISAEFLSDEQNVRFRQGM